MIKNEWLEQAAKEDMTYFRWCLLEPLNFPVDWKKTGLLEGLEENRLSRSAIAKLMEGARLSNEQIT